MSRSRWAARIGRGRLAARLAVVVPLGMVGASVLGGSAASALPSGCVQSGSAVTCTFDYTGAAQNWTVPAEVTQATFTLYGATGGTQSVIDAAGGLGAEVIGTLPVTPGTVLQVNVGQAGNINLHTVFGGGGGGGDDGASGGGASDIRRAASDGSYPLANRLLVAAGGGGGGIGGSSTGAASGGAGGNAGSAGQTAVTDTSEIPGVALGGGVGGGPGASAAGGAGGAGGTASPNTGACAPFNTGDHGGAGGSGVGGAGGEFIGGGGGGGGYYGGGGGGGGASGDAANSDACDGEAGGGGGGGGSSFLGSATGTTLDNGVSAPNGAPNGEVIITYTGDLAIASHANVTVNATGSSGAVVTYTAPAVTDPDDASAPAAVCTPKSGSTFAIGTTTVTCTATDSDDPPSTVSTSFTVTVADADLAIAKHADVTVDATGPSGATITYTAPAVTDPDDSSSPAAVCTPKPGSTFAIGTTTVTCTATDTDDTGSPVSATFKVTVKGAAAQLADLYQAALNTRGGKGLARTVALAERQVAGHHPLLACQTLNLFILEVQLETRWRIPAATAAQLIAAARQVEAVLGCSSHRSYFPFGF